MSGAVVRGAGMRKPGNEAEGAADGAGGDADIDMDPADRLARWNAYAIDRARADLGWSPRSLSAQMESYLGWVDGDERRL